MKSFVTCTVTNNTSMVVTDLTDGMYKGKTRVFTILNGCKCFDYSEELSMIATGGGDCT